MPHRLGAPPPTATRVISSAETKEQGERDPGHGPELDTALGLVVSKQTQFVPGST